MPKIIPPWIPWCKGLSRKEEIVMIAGLTGRPRREVACIMMEFWEWADDVTEDGILSRFNFRFISDLIPGTDEDFWRAVEKTGWIVTNEQGIIISNYDVWMGANAKKRLKDARRKIKDDKDRNLFPKKNGNKNDYFRDRETERETYKGKNSLINPSCTVAENQRTEQPVLTFPTNGKPGTWDLLPSKLDEWSAAFPGLDVLAECRKALQWLRDNRRKTARGMPRFLYSWLARTNDKPKPVIPSTTDKTALAAERLRQTQEAIRALGIAGNDPGVASGELSDG